MKIIDAILNKITMYRVVLYELIGLLVAAGILGFFHILPYTPLNILFSVAFILMVCWVVNKIFAWAYNAPSNSESVYITALILALIIMPAVSFVDKDFLVLAFWASALAMASKYIVAIGKKHIFNPAAIGVVTTALVLGQSASWWVGTAAMLPFVIIGGFLVTRKIQRFDLVLASVGAGLFFILAPVLFHGGNIVSFGYNALVSTPLIFFATVMATEPLTSPSTRSMRISYGLLTGILFSPSFHIGSLYTTPELALAVGNIFSYIVSPKRKLVLKLKAVEQLSPDSFDFVFTPDKPLRYEPGQYMEWTLDHARADSRGIRRYFTLASSPTEKELRLGVKFYNDGSSYKKKMLAMKRGDTIVATGLAGDFTLPKGEDKKLVFIAGGIGITPFRSMIQHMIDTKDKRDTVMIYSNKTVDDIAYKKVFDTAERNLRLKAIYAVTDSGTDISRLPGAVRKIDAYTITENIPDFKERLFYLSGPRGMVESFEVLLQSLGVKRRNIKTDFFPGFA